MGVKHHKIAEYSKALEDLIKQGLEKRNEATELISATSQKLKEAKELGIDITKPDRLLKKAQTILKSTQEIKEYDDALKYAENSNKLVTKSITDYNQANKIILFAKEKHTKLVKKGIILTTPQNLINDAEKAIKSNNYVDATKLAKQSLQKLKAIELDYLKFEKLISTANTKLAEATKTKLQITKAEQINDQITTFKKKGDYPQAIQLTQKLIKTVDNLMQTYNEGTNLIEKAFTLINEAKSLEADTLEAETFYDEAATEMEQGSYEKAIQLANNSIKSAEQVKGKSTTKLQQKSEEVLSELDEKLKNAKKIGANINESIIMVFDQVKSAFEKNNFKFAFDNAELCKNSIEEARNQHQNALDKIQVIRAVINEANEAGANTNNAERMISEAEEALENYDYAAIDTQINLAQEETGRARERHHQVLGQKEQAEGVIKTAKTTITEIKNAGIIATQSEELLTKAETAFSNSEFQAAQTQANTAIKECQEVQKLFLDVKENLQKAETSIAKSKLFIDTTEVEKLFEQSQTSMNSGNYSEALEFTSRIITSIETVKTNYKPVIKLKSSEVPTFKSGSWGKMQLELVNEGKIHANDIKFNVSEELESRGFFNISVLKAGTSRTIDMGLRTNEIGDLPVNIDISYLNPVNQEQLSTQQILWVKTEPGEPGQQPEAIEVPQEAPGPPTGPEGEVKVLSEVEFFQGFIRLKVGVKNDQNTVITDTKLDIEYDDTAMRFDKIEPDLTRKGNKIIFGNIHPKEKKTVACYLDPLICMESHIDGTLTYKDIWGNLKTAVMKRRKAEIVCPIFYTPENINTAMLKRMVEEELAIHDSKIYEIPFGVDFKRANDICKETIQGHDLKFVREFIESDIDDPEIESWFYGITKVKKNQVVIKASCRKTTNTIELFVACKSKQTLTGFLAELAHNLNDKLKELGIITQPILPVTDIMTRDKLSQTASLLANQILDKATLSLSKRGDEYEVGFKATEEGGEASEVFEFIKVSPDSREDIISQIGDVVTISNIFYCTRGKLDTSDEEKILEEVKKELSKKGDSNRAKEIADSQLQNIKSLGKLVYGMFLPVQVQTHLESIKEPLILKTNDNEIPWELLHDDTDFLCLKVPIGRRLRSREVPRVNPTTESEKIRFLFIVNATGDLDSAEEEVDYIQSNLGPDVEVEILKRSQATNASILSALRSGKYDIIHYAGHAEFNMESPDESALFVANNGRIFAQEIKRVLGGKPFVFLNACSSGREKMCETGESYTGSDTEGLASSFILGGAMGFIGASWPTPDLSSGILASEFYKHFLSGEPVGEALRKARLHLKSERPKDINWMAFILYGDPTMKLSIKASS